MAAGKPVSMLTHDLTLTGIDWTVDDRPHHYAKHVRCNEGLDDALAEIEWREDRKPRACSVCGGRGWFMRTASHAPWVEIPTECVDCP